MHMCVYVSACKYSVLTSGGGRQSAIVSPAGPITIEMRPSALTYTSFLLLRALCDVMRHLSINRSFLVQAGR